MKRQHLITAIAGVMLLSMLCTGCQNQQVTPDQVRAMAKAQQVISEQIDKYQQIADDLEATIAAGGLVDPDVTARYEEITAALDELQAGADRISKAIEVADYSGAGTLATFLEAAQAGNAAAPPYPYKEIVALALAAAGGLTAAIQGQAKKKALAATEQIVKGLDKAVEAGALDMTKVGPILASKQSTTTAAIVDKIQGKA